MESHKQELDWSWNVRIIFGLLNLHIFFLHQQSCWWTLFSDLDTEVRSGHKECTGQVEAFWIGSSHIENVFDSLRIFLRLFFSDSYSLTKLILQATYLYNVSNREREREATNMYSNTSDPVMEKLHSANKAFHVPLWHHKMGHVLTAKITSFYSKLESKLTKV